MRILFLAASNNIHTIRWVNALVQKGHEIHLITNKNHFESNGQINHKVKIIPLHFGGTKGYYLNIVQLKKLFKKINPDVVNTHYASGYGTLARLAAIKPNVLSIWGSDVFLFPHKSRLNFNILTRNIRSANRITSSSHVMADYTNDLLNQSLPIDIIPFGVDMNQFKPYSIVNYKSEITLGVVKSLERVYGIDDIIKAYHHLKERLKKNKINMRVKLEIYGEGSIQKDLEVLSERLNVKDTVHFNGYKKNEELPEALNKMDIFCLGSISESFGVSAVEAMACGLPIVATDTPGFKEVVKDNKTGFIVPKRDPHSMANKMYELLLDESLRNEMGKEGRKRAINLYDWDCNVEEMDKIYRELSCTR